MTTPENYRLVVRHGEYDHRNGDLTEQGIEDVKQSVQDIAYILGESASAATLVSSPVRRAAQTAEVIATELGVDTDENGIIFEGFLRDDSPEVLTRDEMVRRIVEKIGARATTSVDKFIVVTHLPQVIELAGLDHFGKLVPAHGDFYTIAED